MTEPTATASSSANGGASENISVFQSWYARTEQLKETNLALLSKIEESFSYNDEELVGVTRKDNTLEVFRYKEPDGAASAPMNADIENRSIIQPKPAEDSTEIPRTATITDALDAEADFIMILLPHTFQHLSTPGFDPRKPGSMNFSIGLSKKCFDATMDILQAHPLFLEALFSRVGQYGILDTAAVNRDDPSIIHVIVKIPPAGHLEAAFYIRFDTEAHKMRLIIAGDDLHALAQDIINFLQYEQAELDPFEFALILIRRYYYFLDAQCVQVDHAVIMTERETGRGAVAYSDGQANHSIRPDKFDLTFMHWIEGNQRNLVYAAQFQSKLTAFLMKEHMTRVRYTTKSPSEDHYGLPLRARSLCARYSLHQTAVEGLHAASLVMRERIQRQLSAADSIINQYDNKISLDNAAVNTTIAEQSRKIASETQKDSTSMKTIAGLTMVYLPITFTATIFSTGFFTYNSDDGSLMVNSRIWIFFVVGIILTILTIIVWIWLNKYGIPKHLSWARHGPTKDEQLGYVSKPVQPGSALFQQGYNRPPLQILSDPRVDLPAPA